MRTVEEIRRKREAMSKAEDLAMQAAALQRCGRSKREISELLGMKRCRILDKVSAELAPPRGKIGWLRAYRFHPQLALKALQLASVDDYVRANQIMTDLIGRSFSKRSWGRLLKRYAYLLTSANAESHPTHNP